MPKFVIQAHTKRKTRHFDLMLERDGVLKTWSIPAVFKPNTRIVGWQFEQSELLPPIVGCNSLRSNSRAIKAKMLPDHRLLYLAYEGKLSRGRGSVKIWDKGSYKDEFWDKNIVCVILGGKRLKGKHLLIRLNKTWVLIRK